MLTLLIVVFLVCMLILGFTYDVNDPELKRYQVFCAFFALMAAIAIVLCLLGVVSERELDAMFGIQFGR